MQKDIVGNSFSKNFFTPIVKKLIIANLLVFIVTHLFYSARWFHFLGLVPALVIKRLALWQPVTYLFLHAGLLHLTINMLMLFFFGSALEAAWGGKRFLKYYFFTGISAAVCSIIFSFDSNLPIVGASGAIFGLLVAYARTFPESVILLFFIFPVKVRYAVIFLAVINLLGALSAPGGDVAYLTHLAGGVFGYFYLIHKEAKGSLLGSNKLINNLLLKFKRLRRQKTTTEINAILDKINSEGWDSLSRAEVSRLKRFSDKK